MLHKSFYLLPFITLAFVQPVAAQDMQESGSKVLSFQELDADSSGMVSREEFTAMSGMDSSETEFGLIDANQDNNLTEQEIENYNQSHAVDSGEEYQ